MCEGYVEKPLYLLIAEWMMAENRWVIAREISIHFDIEHSKAVNTLTYILSEVTEISCEVKGSDSNLLIVFYVQIMPDDLVMQLHR
ncbi:CaiF/GrlA family transcriptional regulator, partial [Escherichia coli]|nr:CaiF/GrlA family transcriptional regulator [Escherichia coli]